MPITTIRKRTSSLCICVIVLLCAGAWTTAPAAFTGANQTKEPTTSRASLWDEIDEATLGTTKQSDRLIVPRAYRVFRLDEAALDAVLATAPLESTAKPGSGGEITLPMPDGRLERFRFQESPIMEDGLAAQWPDIKTYAAQGIDDLAATVRFDRTPQGFHAQILSPRGAVYIDPFRRGDTGSYVVYYKRDFVKDVDDWVCHVPDFESAEKVEQPAVVTATGQTLRTYRLALACTGEYAQFHGGTVNLAFAAMTTSLNRVNGVYEVDVAIRMILVANNTSLVFTNGATDPYTNNNGSQMLGQNQTTCDNVIGAANYDVGHVFSTGGGGVAGLGVICRGGQKARGVTGLGQPVGDPFDIDYVAHEMGHQYGANHTFNGTSSSCAGNRAASAAYEPGSGSTIMAYAGICGSVNLQSNSDPYFHIRSYEEIVNYTNNGAGNPCAVQSATGNLPASIDAGANKTIPANTPFELTAASAADPNGDTLTYCWEEFDLGAALNTNTDNGSSPIFRSFNPSASPTRVFPKIANLVSNTTTFGEVLPSTNRTMNFRCTVRDNRAGGGGVDFDSMQVTSTTAAGPFAVTSPNAATTFAGGSAQAITWNVASTDTGAVNTPQVSISLSVDGGLSFPIVLSASTPNDGSEVVTLPNAPTAMARIKVKGAGNVFFDISNANFTITSGVTGGDSAGIYIPATGGSFLRNSNTPGSADATFIFGPAPSTLVPIYGDWDGNHTRTIGLYDPVAGSFFLKNANGSGAADITFGFGPAGGGFQPIAGDWDGDGVDTIGLYSSATGAFFLKNTNGPGAADVVVVFGPGGAGFVAIVGDWDGSLTDTIGVYNPATGVFFLKNFNTSGPADVVVGFGAPGAIPLRGDWNLDGTDTIGIYVAATGAWFLRNSNTPGAADVVFIYGPAGATPIAGDWDGL